MLSTNKRIGYFFLCLVPLIIVVVLQFLLSIPAVAIAGLWTFLHGSLQDLAFSDTVSKLQENLRSGSFTVGVSAAYAIFALVIFGIWYWKRFAREEENVPIKQALNPAVIGSLALLAIGGQYVTTYLVTLVASIVPSWMQQYESLMQTIDADQPTLLLMVYQ